MLRKGKHHSPALQNAWSKYGETALLFHVLEVVENPTRERLLEREQWYLDNMKPDYNVAQAAGSRLGAPQSQSTRERIAAASKGLDPEIRARREAGLAALDHAVIQHKRRETIEERKANGRTYVIQSPLNKERLLAASRARKGIPTGRKPTPENIAKLVEATKKRWASGEVVHPMQGKSHSDEAKAKMAAAKRGKPSVKRSDPTKCAKLLHEWVEGARECRLCTNIAQAASRRRRIEKAKQNQRAAE